MNSPFTLHEINDSTWGVAWTKFDVDFTNHMKFNLVDFVFKNIKCFEVGLFIVEDAKTNDGATMWMNQNVFFQEISEEYAQYLYKYYKILGVVFRKQEEAELFKELLEKRYAWHLLKD